MPIRAAHPCSQPGCPALVKDGRYCDAHRKVPTNKSFASSRGTTTERGYGAHWRKIRALHLAREPLCRECGKEDRATAATTVDHIVAKAHGGTDADENLQSLCEYHKRQKDARERWSR